jgi:mRNA-degrading endonuclease toxin of MazEF toxin-antitoxin module
MTYSMKVLPANAIGFDRNLVAQASQIMTADKSQLIEPIGRIGERLLEQLMTRLDIAMGRSR